MKSDTPLDYAIFQLSPKRSRCELFVSCQGETEKLASGLLKPFASHLQVAEEQVAQAVQSIRLEVQKNKGAGNWFTKGTLERFVRFVSTPEVLELANTFDAEMSQLEAARRIYLQGVGDRPSDALGDNKATSAAADITKRELLRAIDLRLGAVRQDLIMSCARAASAGFTLDNVSELQLFADRFGAHRLNEACTKFISLCQRRPDLCQSKDDDDSFKSFSGSDMSIDDVTDSDISVKPDCASPHEHHPPSNFREEEGSTRPVARADKFSTWAPTGVKNVEFPLRRSSRDSSSERDEGGESDRGIGKETERKTEPAQPSQQQARRLSVQDRINLFENKQKEQQSAEVVGRNNKVGKPELRRLSSDIGGSASVEKAVLRRWSGTSDMSIELNTEKIDNLPDSSSTVSSSSNSRSDFAPSRSQSGGFPSRSEEVGKIDEAQSQSHSRAAGWTTIEDVRAKESVASRVQLETPPSSSNDTGSKGGVALQTQFRNYASGGENAGLKGPSASETKLRAVPSGEGYSALKDPATSQTQFRAFPVSLDISGLKDSQTQLKAFSSSSYKSGLKDQGGIQNQFRSFPSSTNSAGLNDPVTSQIQFRAFSNSLDSSASKDSISSDSQSRSFSTKAEDIRLKDPAASQIQSIAVLLSKSEDVELNDPADPRTQSDSFLSKTEDTRLKEPPGLQNQFEASETQLVRKDLTASQSQFTAFLGNGEDMGRREAVVSQSRFRSFPIKGNDSRLKDSGPQETKLQRQTSASEQSKKMFGWKDDGQSSVPLHQSVLMNGNDKPSGRKVAENSVMPSIEQAQKTPQSKGNQELNKELQMKADELEALFAAHKLRVPGDLLGTGRRNTLVEAQMEPGPTDVEKKLVHASPSQWPEKNPGRESLGSSSNVVEFDVNLLMKMIDNPESSNNSSQKLANYGSSGDLRGKFYERYMQKREAKLREESGQKREQKEANMKAMQDSLERSRAEMEARFMGSSDRQDPALHAHLRAERLRSFNLQATMKIREQQQAECFQSEEEENAPNISEHTMFSSDGSSKTGQQKNLLPTRSSASFTSRTSLAAIPRPSPSVKATNSSLGRRRNQAENPLAQSVPNFSDFRKENTKPLTGIGKTSTRSQSKNYSRSKSTREGVLVKEEKHRRSQSMRKSSASPGELDYSPLNSDTVILPPLNFSKDQTEQSLYNKITKNGNSRPFLRKGNGIGPGAGPVVAKLKASMVTENLKDGEDMEELADQPEDPAHVVREEEFGEETGEDLKAVDFNAALVSEEARMSQESAKSGDLGLENGEVSRTLSCGNDSISAMAAVSENFDPFVVTTQDSPGESPASWNSHTHHSFSYALEASDVDASVDSPIGSPASWNSHSMSQVTEAEAARMRKKWGSAQKPFLVAAASQQSCKDVTKGFKRLLKFGRKSRGADNLVTDWVSASTTSEGDDDFEDGRDLANRSSEDLRKSRMGFLHSHPSYEDFHEGVVFHEQAPILSSRSSIPTPTNYKLREDQLSGSSLKAPRSFFSLSSFRSKGSDSKLR